MFTIKRDIGLEVHSNPNKIRLDKRIFITIGNWSFQWIHNSIFNILFFLYTFMIANSACAFVFVSMQWILEHQIYLYCQRIIIFLSVTIPLTANQKITQWDGIFRCIQFAISYVVMFASKWSFLHLIIDFVCCITSILFT